MTDVVRAAFVRAGVWSSCCEGKCLLHHSLLTEVFYGQVTLSPPVKAGVMMTGTARSGVLMEVVVRTGAVRNILQLINVKQNISE